MYRALGRRYPVTLMLAAFIAVASSGLRIPGSALQAAPAVWTNPINVTVNGSTITKTSGVDHTWNASAITQQALTGNGRFRFSAPASVGDKVVVGLSTDPSANGFMPFSLSFGGTLAITEVREGSTYKAEIAWQPGDVFEIAIFNGNRVRYAKNGTVFYTSQTTAVLPLQLDATIATLNTSLSNVDFENESTAAIWTNTINSTANGSTITKTGGFDLTPDASALTQQALNGNGRIRFNAPAAVGQSWAFGLSTDPTANRFMPFALSFGNGTLAIAEVREGPTGTYKAEIAWQTGDVFEIEVFNGNQVRYAKNGTVFYTSQTTATLPLHGDVIILSLNASITNVVIDGGGTPPTNPPGAPQTYDLRTDTAVIGTGPATAPNIGPAGTSVMDTEFGTRITRVTDATTAANGRSWGTPDAPNANAIASDDRKFFAFAEDGSTALIYNFDPATGAFSPDHEAVFLQAPTFSRKIEKPTILYSPHHGYTVVAYNAATQARSTLITLTDEVGAMDPGTQFVSSVYSSEGTPERIAVPYGGVQNTHRYLTVFDVDNPANRVTINTRTSQIRVNGGSWQPLLTPSGTQANINFGLHSIAMDRSGKWVKLDIPGNEGGPMHTAFFNVATGRLHEWTSNAWAGHYSLGWEAHVTSIADPNGGGTYQWLFTDMTQAGLPPPWRPLISPPPPANDQITTDHSNWNNARADLLVPVISGTQRGTGSTQWARWYDEIVAVATQPNPPAQVYRAGRHYVAIYDANGNSIATFRDSPRPQVTHDGMWTFFTSNWGLKLGTFGSGALNHRRDLFVVRMARE